MSGISHVQSRIEMIRSRLGMDTAERLPVEEFDAAFEAAHNAGSGIGRHWSATGPTTLGAMLSGTLPNTSGWVPAWRTPAVGPVVSGFGHRSDPFTGETRMHQGIDIDAAAGDPIWATDAGVVSFAGERGGFGKLVIVDHGEGVETYYAHQQRIDVSVGDRVAAGHQLGLVGSTGRSTGPHLHFEVRVDGEPVDPESFVPGAAHDGHSH